MRYFIDPFGCAKNQVDAENMMLHLEQAGWVQAPDAGDADLIIVNSCGFIESAKQESINAVLEWRAQYPDKKILLAGCLAQRYAKELGAELTEADGFFGINDISEIAEKAASLAGSGGEGIGSGEWGVGSGERSLQSALVGNQPRFRTTTLLPTPHSPLPNPYPLPPNPYPPTSTRPLLSLPGSAYVKISEGCSNNCAFCAIPLIRGPLRCRTVADIVEECRGLLARGIKELCVIGQDIGSYQSQGARLAELLNAIAQINGDFWVRLLYMHPDHFPLPILDLMEKDKRFLPYFDIPFQHGSQKILAAMNRRGSAEAYLSLAATIRGRIPAAVIRTTFLLGFPGETDADFAALLDFQQQLRADWMGCFIYSREEGTSACSMHGQVPHKNAARRKRRIEERQIPITEQNMDRFIGQSLDALLEEQFDHADGSEPLWLGRLYCHAPEVDGAAIASIGSMEAKAGDIVPCTVTSRKGIDLVSCLLQMTK